MLEVGVPSNTPFITVYKVRQTVLLFCGLCIFFKDNSGSCKDALTSLVDYLVKGLQFSLQWEWKR